MDVKYYLEPINMIGITGNENQVEYHFKGGSCFVIPKILLEKGLANINACEQLKRKEVE